MEEHEAIETPSKSQRKREMQALQALGVRLVDLPARALDAMPLDPALREAIDAARAITARGGRRRQLQFIGRLMREVDAEPIRAAFALLDNESHADQSLQRTTERWRARLLDGGDEALGELIEAHPGVDHQHLRRLVRDARKERDESRPPRLQRELFRLLRTLFEE